MENIQTLGVEHLPSDLGGREKIFKERRKKFQLCLPEEGIALQDVEKELMRQALEKANNNMTKAAKLIQVSYDTFRYQAKKYRLAVCRTFRP